ncbi:MAG: transposase [Candidatus Saccharimonadales bacterium]
MPARNTIRAFETGGYYHVYNRGAGKQPIFLDDYDKEYYLHLIARYLDPKVNDFDGSGAEYPKFDSDVELLAYCLMRNHIHLLFYIKHEPSALPLLIKSLTVSYTMYFNLKYTRPGTLFQGKYRAARITRDDYLQHISRYIHLNPRNYARYQYSSYRSYTGGAVPRWLHPERILQIFKGYDYRNFVDDHKEHKSVLEVIKTELANS